MIIRYDERNYNCSDEFSQKDFTHKFLTDRVLDGLVIYASSFSHEEPDTRVFPPNMTGVIFLNCSLDNVIVPPGNVVLGGSQRRYRVQNDLRDWEIDAEGNPTVVLNEKHWEMKKISTDPRDIPATPFRSVDELYKKLGADQIEVTPEEKAAYVALLEKFSGDPLAVQARIQEEGE